MLVIKKQFAYCGLLIYIYYFFQVFGENRTSIGKTSNLPASISKISTSFVGAEKKPKFPAGPTKFSPGPTLLMVAATAEKLVVKSYPSMETASTDNPKITKKATKKAFSERTTSCSTTFLSSVIFFTCFGWMMWPISLVVLRIYINQRETFIPPPVLPAHAPINISHTSTVLDSVGHRLKSFTTNPVVEIMDATVNGAWPIACAKVYPPLKHKFAMMMPIATNTMMINALTSAFSASFHLRLVSKK